MNKESKLAVFFSRMWQWTVRSVNMFFDKMSDRRQRKRAEREEKREQHRMRRTVYEQNILGMAIFSIAYWVLALILFNNFDISYTLYYMLSDVLQAIDIYIDTNDVPVILITAYLIILFIWAITALRKAAGYLDRVYIAADNILDKSRDMPRLPSGMSHMDVKLRSIHYSIIQNEQLAREAEQRKNDLVVYLAHDLKTPLSSVIGYLTLLSELPDIPVEQRAKYTEITLDKAYRLEQLINEFFDITRFNLQSIELEHNRIDLSMLLMQIADEFYPVLEEKNLRIKLKLQKKLMMTGDADKLMRVFDNLLRNAAAYSYENTEIILAARRTEDYVEILCRNEGDMIPPESLSRLFEKFFRADSARHSSSAGSGLGLAIAKHIVELHGGEIMAESNKEYTQFFVALPIKYGDLTKG